MICPYFENCGGCTYCMSDNKYKTEKINKVKHILSEVIDENVWNNPCFIEIKTRRRATFAFSKTKNKINFGFNKRSSSEIVSIENCLMLKDSINQNIGSLKCLIHDICNVSIWEGKGKKRICKNISNGDIHVCVAENGLDIVIISSILPNLEIREIIAEHITSNANIIRVSWKKDENAEAEIILEKTKPYILINGFYVYIPAGTFLQPSSEGEFFLRKKVLEYLKNTEGKVADLFCGIGTFSYELCKNSNVKILASDSSPQLLEAFQHSLNKNQITNIEICKKNLFKYPLEEEIENYSALVIDPPRAGASQQIKAITKLNMKPEKIVMISCNPHSFLKDCKILNETGYFLKEITMLDQFAYSNHSEIIALFTK